MPARTRLPASIRALIPAQPKRQIDQNRKLTKNPLLVASGVGSMLELALLHRLQRTDLPQPLTQQTFHPTRKWTLDFAWPDQKLAAEVEGGIFGKPGPPCPLCKQRKGGAHGSISGILRDVDKYNALTLAGWRVLRITGAQIESGEAVRLIAAALGGRTE